MGVDFTDRQEYTRQMPETLNAIKILRGKGIKVIVPQESNWNDRLKKNRLVNSSGGQHGL